MPQVSRHTSASISNAAGTFAGISVTLAGFSLAFVVLILTELAKAEEAPYFSIIQDFAMTLLLIGGVLYIISSTTFVTSLLESDSPVKVSRLYNIGLILFLAANVVLALSLLLILLDFHLLVASTVSALILLFTIIISAALFSKLHASLKNVS